MFAIVGGIVPVMLFSYMLITCSCCCGDNIVGVSVPVVW